MTAKTEMTPTEKAIGLAVITPFMILVLMPVIAVVCAYQGFILSVLWEWFVVSIFGARHLSVLQSAAVMVLVGFFWYRPSYIKDEFMQKPEKQILGVFLTPMYFLIVGWIVHLCLLRWG